MVAKGDSMEPTISDNETVMVDTSERKLRNGHIYVIRNGDHLLVKRIQTLWKVAESGSMPSVSTKFSEKATDLRGFFYA